MKPRRGATTRRRGTATDAAARERLEALFARIDRLIPDDLAHLGLGPGPDDGARAAVREQALDVAEQAGLGQLVDDAVAEARERILRRWADGLYRPSWVGMLNWGVSLGRAEDRLAVVAAIEDAALAAIVGDLVEPEGLETLSVDADHVLGLASGGPSEDSLASAIHVVNASHGHWLRIAVLAIVLWVLASILLVSGSVVGAVSLSSGLVMFVGMAILAMKSVSRRSADAGSGTNTRD